MTYNFSGKSEFEYQLLFQENPIPMMVYEDGSLKILAVNKAAVEKYGYSEDEFTHLDILQIRPPEDIPEFIQTLEAYKNTSKRIGNYRHVKKDNEIVEVEVYANKVHMWNKDVWLVAAHDITKRKVAESRIAKLFKITRIIVASVSIDEAFEQIFSMICKYENWDSAELRLLNEDTGEFVFESYWSINQERRWFKKLFDNCKKAAFSSLENLVQGRESYLFLKDLQKSEVIPYKASLIALGIKSAHIFPLTKEPDLHGILIFYDRKDKRLNKNSLIELQAITQQLAFFIKKIKTRETLKQSQLRLSGIVDSAMDAIITIDANQNILLFNHAAEKMFMLKSSEAMGKPLDIIIPNRYRNLHKEHIDKFGRTGVTARKMGALGTLSGLRTNGDEFPIEASISQIDTGTEKLYTVILRDITERKRSEEQINASLKEKEILLKEIHHRVKNNLQIISSLMNLQRAHIKDRDLSEIFNESQHRIKTMALIHEKLYKNNLLSKIKFREYVTELVNYLVASYDYNVGDIYLNIDVDDVNISLDIVVTLGLILNELLTNSLKYAFPGKRDGIIDVKFHIQLDETIKFIFSDNGVGFPADYNFDDIPTLGNQLILNLVDQLNGTINYDFKHGTRIIMNFALKEKLELA